MPSFRNEHVAFEAPEGWEDRTIVAFAAPATPEKFTPNVVMTKDPLKPGETIRSYADRQIMELARRLEGFELVESDQRVVAGVTAIQYRFVWMSEHAELHQQTVMLAPADVVFTFTGTSTKKDEGELSLAMEELLGSISFPGYAPPYDPTGGAPPPPAEPAGTGWVRTR